MAQRVVILGASDKPERYAYMAFKMLREYGHTPLPVSNRLKMIEGIPVAASLSDIKGPVDTLLIYVNAEISTRLNAELIGLGAKRVIFTPGSENPELAAALQRNGAHVVEACTMVLLRTKQFETL